MFLVGSCASHRYLGNSGHELFDRRDFVGAAEQFKKEASKKGANQLLFMLDQAMSHFAAKQYKEAIDVFLAAEKVAEIKDYTSISEETGTLLTGDNVRGYKGEDFEKVLINIYLALSYSALGNSEDAQVEARKINLLLYKMIHEGKRNYQESPLARYLSAMLWENTKDWDSAYVDYKNTYDLDSTFPEIDRDLLAMSRKNGFSDRLEEWRKKFPNSQERSIKKNEGEIVVFFEAGRGPEKIPRDGENSNLPRYIRRSSDRLAARVKLKDKTSPKLADVLDIESLSINYLEDRISRMAAAKLAGIVAKGVVAYGAAKATKDSDLGQLLFIALLAADQADLRAWRTLPAKIQILRWPMTEGAYDLQVEVLGVGDIVLDTISFSGVSVQKGKKTFLIAR